jgi:integrase/recombinase XerD
MASRRPKTAGTALLKGGAAPGTMRALMASFLEWLAVRGYAEESVEYRAYCLHWFAGWCEERGILRAAEVTRPILQRYQRWLFYYRKKNGRPLGVSTQHSRVVMVGVFFRWATRNNFILYNPASELELPHKERRLPRAILSVAEVEKVLSQPDLRTPLGVRDRAVLEVLYSTGMRRAEATALTLFAIDQERGTVMVRLGKGKKDRVVPIGERALGWVEKYLTDVRPQYAMEPDEGVLFLTGEGEAITPGHLSALVSAYVDAAGIGKRGSCHLFRHTMATLMLENGADTRFIQALLGHEQLSSTQLYTQVAIGKLKEIHTATHPGAKLARKQHGQEGESGEDELDRAEIRAELEAEAVEDGEEGHPEE